MPVYCYKCEDCNEEFEIEQKVSDPNPECPKTEKTGQKHKVKRLISLTSFVLKGGGWGRDLYSSPKKS